MLRAAGVLGVLNCEFLSRPERRPELIRIHPDWILGNATPAFPQPRVVYLVTYCGHDEMR
jgi:hypothetical protein